MSKTLFAVPIFFALFAGMMLFFVIRDTLPQTESNVVGDIPSGIAIDTNASAEAISLPAGHVEYHNSKYGFSFLHASEGIVTEYNEGSGAATIVYENKKTVRGFQIFIIPYALAEISEERFKADVSSGIRKEVKPATLDGVEAVTFTSYDQSLGDTTEIWVIHGGYLYEITTLKGVGDLLNPIIQSWRFLK